VRGNTRLVRGSVVGVVAAAVLVLTPGVAAADSGVAQRDDCERIWMWWIPLPCLRE
jgi:hypothetical protein